ncbi:hypothetical protein CP500_015950 [Tychonema bourrellyi FEM_GT703]|uniref:Uncharacterized protein n=1 Tax=Tychonema bourrellyi FEM_GT703 TaxID=2040638 RepID=A0A2G4EZ64_9CYAN|nr:hypothetical protein CP500_015950 [Tychonema bourrellyi FEM_GT703]
MGHREFFPALQKPGFLKKPGFLISCTCYIFLGWAGRMPTPQQKLIFVEQASCLLLKMAQDIQFSEISVN